MIRRVSQFRLDQRARIGEKEHSRLTEDGLGAFGREQKQACSGIARYSKAVDKLIRLADCANESKVVPRTRLFRPFSMMEKGRFFIIKRGNKKMKQLKKGVVGLVAAAVLITLAACGNTSSTGDTQSGENSVNAVEEKVVGVAPGPYGDMVTEVISPLLEEKGYQLTTKVFNDYIQPNNALANGQIDANLFQHTAYLEKFSADNQLSLTALQKVPTLGMGIYSKQLSSLDELADGATVSIANDASNLARTLQLLAANELITIADNIDETKATVNDIEENPKNLTFKELDAAQLARSLDTVDLALVPGNFAWAASLDPADALALESLKEEYKNVFVVSSEEEDSDFAKAVTEVLESDAFKEAIAESPFSNFDQPKFWTE